MDIGVDLNPKNFNFIATRVYDSCGVNLDESKVEMLRSRLIPRLRELGFMTFKEYICFLENNYDDEEFKLVNSITTNFTSFFREKHHFDYMQEVLIPQWLKEKKDSKTIKIWSAGCSSGEEPYTIAMSLLNAMPQLEYWDVKILATDIDTNILNMAKKGEYNKEKVEDLDKALVKHWFKPSETKPDTHIQVSPKIQKMVHFRHLNFMHDWPMKGQFDLIFCRNVIIYFDKETQARIMKRFSEYQSSGAHLFIGHSESLHQMSETYKLIGKAMYQCVGGTHAKH
ncbi:MAG: protein-glutamate O-methyltransferase CheR [Pseudomonadales bacterium]|nr:protein-glutamate O-methyltransferase CheR [Pseudomonadales bacterium]